METKLTEAVDRPQPWGNRAIAPPEIFKNMFICLVQVAIILLPENISWLRP